MSTAFVNSCVKSTEAVLDWTSNQNYSAKSLESSSSPLSFSFIEGDAYFLDCIHSHFSGDILQCTPGFWDLLTDLVLYETQKKN